MMSPVGAPNPNVPYFAAVSSPVSSSSDDAATQMNAFSSVAGITVRLLTSLPLNLGQNFDATA